MKITRFRRLLWLAPIALVIVAGQPAVSLHAQAGKSAAAAGGSYNVAKDILAHKDTLNWKSVDNAIPGDVCTILQVCNGAVKMIALPRATEGGVPVGRGVFLTQDGKKADVIVLERQTPSDTYFFLVTPDGALAKAAYAQVGSRSWLPVGMALGGPVFDKDKVVWHNWASKLGTAAAAEKKPDS